MTSPVPGWVPPNPITWTSGEVISTPRLRADGDGVANLYTSARPMVAGTDASSDVIPTNTGTVLEFTIQNVNSWNAVWLNSATGPTSYRVPLPGYYLMQCFLTQNGGDTGSNQHRFTVGLKTIQNGAAANSFDGGSVTGDGVTGHQFGTGDCDLLLFNSYANTLDTIAVYAFTTEASGSTTNNALCFHEWVGIPANGSTLTGYTGPYGTVVSSPWAAALPGSGPGTQLVNSVSAGASSLQVKDPTGIVAGGALGLDWYFGNPVQNVAEQVTVNTISGNTVTTTTNFLYAHAANAPVAVPVSAAWLNQQSRDVIQFLAYPPMLRAAVTATQSIASTAFPPTVGGNPGNQVTNLSATIDSFSGFSSNTYTVPVSGVYFVYGQIAYTGSTTSNVNWGVGVSVSGGTILWGTLTRTATVSAGTQNIVPTFRRHLRLTAGQTLTFWAYQNSGANNTITTGSTFSKFVVVWRSF